MTQPFGETDQQHVVHRKRDWPQWFKICEQLHGAIIDFFAKDSDNIVNGPEERMVEDIVPLHKATGIGSRTMNFKGQPCDWHQPLLDIDVPHVYMPSTTEGHGHLIFRKRMPWADYLKLMEVMAEVGLLEKGFVEAAKTRGEAWLRTPWTDKNLGPSTHFNPKTGWNETVVEF